MWAPSTMPLCIIVLTLPSPYPLPFLSGRVQCCRLLSRWQPSQTEIRQFLSCQNSYLSCSCSLIRDTCFLWAAEAAPSVIVLGGGGGNLSCLSDPTFCHLMLRPENGDSCSSLFALKNTEAPSLSWSIPALVQNFCFEGVIMIFIIKVMERRKYFLKHKATPLDVNKGMKKRTTHTHYWWFCLQLTRRESWNGKIRDFWYLGICWSNQRHYGLGHSEVSLSGLSESTLSGHSEITPSAQYEVTPTVHSEITLTVHLRSHLQATPSCYPLALYLHHLLTGTEGVWVGKWVCFLSSLCPPERWVTGINFTSRDEFPGSSDA